MNKKIKYGLISIAIVTPASFIAGHEIALRSEPFSVMKQAVETSQEVQNYSGPITSIHLGWLGYMVKYSGPSGSAAFEVTVHGSRHSLTVFSELER
ncbi:MAG TPA: hypothetical protein VNI58_08510, partial [Mariprofundaceae bacterium]|nr:hypothetical protein [Mariprofundaceae bacterium]